MEWTLTSFGDGCRLTSRFACAGEFVCSTTFTLMRGDTTGGECGMWFLSPNTSCKVCSPGVSDISASVWPALRRQESESGQRGEFWNCL